MAQLRGNLRLCIKEGLWGIKQERIRLVQGIVQRTLYLKMLRTIAPNQNPKLLFWMRADFKITTLLHCLCGTAPSLYGTKETIMLKTTTILE